MNLWTNNFKDCMPKLSSLLKTLSNSKLNKRSNKSISLKKKCTKSQPMWIKHKKSYKCLISSSLTSNKNTPLFKSMSWIETTFRSHWLLQPLTLHIWVRWVLKKGDKFYKNGMSIVTRYLYYNLLSR